MRILKKSGFGLLVVSFVILFSSKNNQAKGSSLEKLKESLLIYEDCESLKSKNIDKGIRISGTVVEGKIGKGLLFERRTVNLISNPDFSSSLENWIEIGSPHHLEEDSSLRRYKEIFYGKTLDAGCAEVDENNYLRQVVTKLKTGEWYCLSFYAKTSSPEANIEIKVDEITKEDKVFSEYKRVVVPFKATRESSTITIKGKGKEKIIIDGVQLESKKTFPSSFIKEKQRNGQSIKVKVTEQTFNLMEGSIALWFKPQWIGETSTACRLFGWGDREKRRRGSLSVHCWPEKGLSNHSWRNRILHIHWKEGKGMAVKGTPLTELEPDTWHHLVANWKINPEGLSLLTLYLDGELSGKKEVNWGKAELPSYFHIGSWKGGYADGIIDEVYIFNKALSLEEVETLYQLKEHLQ